MQYSDLHVTQLVMNNVFTNSTSRNLCDYQIEILENLILK